MKKLAFLALLILPACSFMRAVALAPHEVGKIIDARSLIDARTEDVRSVKRKVDDACATGLLPASRCAQMNGVYFVLKASKQLLDIALDDWAAAGGDKNNAARDVFRARWDEQKTKIEGELVKLQNIQEAAPTAAPLPDAPKTAAP